MSGLRRHPVRAALAVALVVAGTVLIAISVVTPTYWAALLHR